MVGCAGGRAPALPRPDQALPSPAPTTSLQPNLSQGRCIDLVTVCVQAGGALVLASAAGRVGVTDRLAKVAGLPGAECDLADVTHDTACLSLLGPGAGDLLAGLGAGELLRPSRAAIDKSSGPMPSSADSRPPST